MLVRSAMTLVFKNLPNDQLTADNAIRVRLGELGLDQALKDSRLFTPGALAEGLTTNTPNGGAIESDLIRWLRPGDTETRLILQGMLSAEESKRLSSYPDDHLAVRARGDVPIGAADLWTPYSPGGGIFGDRRGALDLIGAPQVAHPDAGRGVNVVILDYGISNEWLMRHRAAKDGRVVGGWARYGREGGQGKQWFNPGLPRAGTSEHGHMVVRNILSIAPAASIWDVPLLPDTVLGPPGIAMAEAIFYHILRDIGQGKQRWEGGDGKQRPEHNNNQPREANDKPMPREPKRLPPGPWILVNAWGALNPAPYDAIYANHRYSDNPRHCFVEDMPKFSAANIDVVFAAGNCGSPGAQPQCGENSVGPGDSIHGVNAHPSVLTVGAVRVDGIPIGSSAQGPGMLSRNWTISFPEQKLPKHPDRHFDDPRAKPDICAPSHFRETEDGRLLNTGTSAACGVAAGMLAVLRGREVEAIRKDQSVTPRSPEAMRTLLRQSAGGQAWDRQLGWGIANLDKACKELGLP